MHYFVIEFLKIVGDSLQDRLRSKDK